MQYSSLLKNGVIQKLFWLPALLSLGCLISGAYGALHDQISYSVSPDYFHAFKFHQFAIPESQHNRLGAAIVGWLASWWMGLIIGVPVLLVGLVMPNVRTYVTRCLFAFVIVAATAFAVGLGALVWAHYSITSGEIPRGWYSPEGVKDPVAFVRVGTMHNFSYLGGLLGILTASAWLLAERFRLSRLNPSHAISAGAVRNTIGAILMVIGPLVVATSYIVLSHWLSVLSQPTFSLIALVMSLGVGVWGLALFPIRLVTKIWLGWLYVPVAGFLLIIYAFSFLAIVYGEYL